jgi:hypothetical protein
MLETVEVDSWESFEKRLAEIRQAELASGRHGEFLYRGHTDSTWGLATTLERAGREREPISDYYRIISRAKPQIETFTRVIWDILTWEQVERLLQDPLTIPRHKFPDLGEYSYMAHLRHHGFPSPLLDWTRSPYVAAYFAFRSTARPATGRVSIFAYAEKRDVKGSDIGTPLIQRIGPYVRTHKRHFLQQSDYTISAVFDDGGDGWRFTRHEDMFSPSKPDQDSLWKLNIPWTERLKVLKILDTYNVNALSLFDSEESLMETMALRTLEF